MRVQGEVGMFDLENKNIYVNNIKLDYKSFSKKMFVSHKIKLCMVVTGSALWKIENRLISVKEGDVVILNDRMKRVFKEVSEAEGIELLTVEFEPQLFVNQFRGLFYGKDIEKNNVISDHKEINKLFKEIDMEVQKRLPYSKIIIGAKLVEMLSFMMRHLEVSENSNVKIRSDMYRVLEYIDKHYKTEILQQEAAQMIHMSTTRFSKYFSKCMGMGFAEYVMRKRIQMAIYLLKDSEKTVLEIALECGFNNMASFYKAFKKITNLCPGDYRNADNEKVNI